MHMIYLGEQRSVRKRRRSTEQQNDVEASPRLRSADATLLLVPATRRSDPRYDCAF